MFSLLQGAMHAYLQLAVTAGQQTGTAGQPGNENTNPWLSKGKHIQPEGGWIPSVLVPNCRRG